MMRIIDTNEIKELINDLYWEYDRMSSSGKETLDRIDKIFGATTDKKENEYGVR